MSVDNSLVWKACLAEIELSVSKSTFNTFFKSTRLKSTANNIAEIESPNAVINSYLETRYLMLIKSLIEKRVNSPVSVIFSLKQKEETNIVTGSLFETPPSSAPAQINHSAPPSFQPAANIYARRAGLRDDFIFETFAVSGTNEMAHAAALAVAESPGSTYNPFFLYGGVGVGKTHLMQAIGHRIIAKNQDAKLKYLTGEDFTNGFIDAIRTKTTSEFKKQHRHLDAMLLDDIQFIAGKEQVQEEFFHTFNAVLADGGQIILTSDKPPEEIDKIDDRIRSRFQAGLIVDIGTPNFELRCAILKIKSEKKGINLNMEEIQFLGETVKSAREIEGVILTIKSHLLRDPHADLAIATLKTILKIKTSTDLVKRAIDQATILAAVCDYFQIKQTALKGEKRLKEIVAPRQLLMYLLKTEAGMTFSEIGNLLGGRDHTTIMHGVEKMERLVGEDGNLQKQLLEIKSKFAS